MWHDLGFEGKVEIYYAFSFCIQTETLFLLLQLMMNKGIHLTQVFLLTSVPGKLLSN